MKYKIAPGKKVRDGDNTLVEGDIIDLPADVAERFPQDSLILVGAVAVEPEPEPAVQTVTDLAGDAEGADQVESEDAGKPESSRRGRR